MSSTYRDYLRSFKSALSDELQSTSFQHEPQTPFSPSVMLGAYFNVQKQILKMKGYLDWHLPRFHMIWYFCMINVQRQLICRLISCHSQFEAVCSFFFLCEIVSQLITLEISCRNLRYHPVIESLICIFCLSKSPAHLANPLFDVDGRPTLVLFCRLECLLRQSVYLSAFSHMQLNYFVANWFF